MMIIDHQNDKKISSQKEIWVTNIQSKYLILNSEVSKIETYQTLNNYLLYSQRICSGNLFPQAKCTLPHPVENNYPEVLPVNDVLFPCQYHSILHQHPQQQPEIVKYDAGELLQGNYSCTWLVLGIL